MPYVISMCSLYCSVNVSVCLLIVFAVKQFEIFRSVVVSSLLNAIEVLSMSEASLFDIPCMIF